MRTSALGYYPGSLNAITKAMRENLGIEKIETVKTFSYDYNEDKDYRSDIIGQGIRTGDVLTRYLMPNLSGQSVTYAEEWAAKNGITLYKEFVESESIPGIIVNQSVHQDTFLKTVSNVTIYISKPSSNNNQNNDKDEDNDDNEIDEPNIPGNPSDEDNDNNSNNEGDKLPTTPDIDSNPKDEN